MATEEPAVMSAAMHDDDDDEDILVVKRHKRSRPVVKDAEGAVDENAEDTSPRGPIDASQADSPDKSSDDERADDEDGLPGKKKLKLRRKGAIQEEEEILSVLSDRNRLIARKPVRHSVGCVIGQFKS